MKKIIISIFICSFICLGIKQNNAFGWGTNISVEKYPKTWTLETLKLYVEEWLKLDYPQTVNSDSYFVKTHPLLTLLIIDLFEKKYGNEKGWVKLTDEQKREIIWGSIEEDYDVKGTSSVSCYSEMEMSWLLQGIPVIENFAPTPTFSRAFNHFIGPEPEYSPLINVVDTIYDNLPWCGENTSSLLWARNDNRNEMNFSKLKDYGEPDLCINKNKRLKGFRAIGHIIHLLEDCTSPAHVRNDAHPYSDSYEKRIAKKTPFEHYYLIKDDLLNGNVEPLEYSSLDQYIIKLAKYTREHYFSDNTEFESKHGEIDLPAVNIDHDDDEFFYNELNKKVALKGWAYWIKFNTSFIASSFDYIAAREAAKKFATVANDDVVEDGFSDLGLKAIQYGAGLLKLCIDELNNAPPTPSITSIPNSDSVDPNSEMSIDYNRHVIDPDCDSVTFCLEVHDEDRNIVYNSRDNETFNFAVQGFIIPGLEYGKTYWWTIFAIDQLGKRSKNPYSESWSSFTTTIDPNDIDNDGDGYTENQGDCDDGNPNIHPNAAELCNGIDDDCDALTPDGSGDTPPLNTLQEGVCALSDQSCANGAWENDYSGVIDYEADEVSCDGLDNDCDGQVDESCSSSSSVTLHGDNFDPNSKVVISGGGPYGVGGYDTPSMAFDVAISGDYAYVADGYSGLQIIDISVPSSPAWVGGFDTPGDAYGVAISGNYAYVADGDSDLQIIDISVPSSPAWVGEYYMPPGYARGVAISGDYAYVAADWLKIMDISVPSNPVWVGGQYAPPGDAWDVAISGDYMWWIMRAAYR